MSESGEVSQFPALERSSRNEMTDKRYQTDKTLAGSVALLLSNSLSLNLCP